MASGTVNTASDTASNTVGFLRGQLPGSNFSADFALNYLRASLHTLPRYDRAGAPAPTDFSPGGFSAGLLEGGDAYADGIVTGAVFFVALGAALAVVFVVADIVNCRCRRKATTHDEYASARDARRGCRRCCGPRTCFCFSVLALVGLLGAGLASARTLGDGIDGFRRGVDAMTATLTTAADATATLPVLLGSIQDTAEALADAAAAPANAPSAGGYFALGLDAVRSQPSPMIDLGRALQPLRTAVADLSTLVSEDLGAVASQASDGSGSGSDGAPGSSFRLVAIVKLVVTTGVTQTAVLLALLLFSLLTLLPTRCCAGCRRTLTLCDVGYLVALWTLTGLLCAASLLLSDFCDDPHAGLALLANSTLPRSATQLVAFYAACAAPEVSAVHALNAELGGAPVVGTSLLELTDRLQATRSLARGLLRNSTADAALAWAVPPATDLLFAVDQCVASAGTITTNMTCGAVSPAVQDSLAAVCGDSTGAVIMFWVLCMAGCVLIVALNAASAALCRFHPGDVSINQSTIKPGLGGEGEDDGSRTMATNQGGLTVAVGTAPRHGASLLRSSLSSRRNVPSQMVPNKSAGPSWAAPAT